MVKKLNPNVRSYLKNKEINKRYFRPSEAIEWLRKEYSLFVLANEHDMKAIASTAGALIKLPRTELINKERLDDYMKHLYKVPGTNKQVVKKFVRIGEGSIIYSIGHHRFIEIARAAGATYKINEGTGGTVLINLEVFDAYMEQFRQEAIPMKHPLYEIEKEGK